MVNNYINIKKLCCIGILYVLFIPLFLPSDGEIYITLFESLIFLLILSLPFYIEILLNKFKLSALLFILTLIEIIAVFVIIRPLKGSLVLSGLSLITFTVFFLFSLYFEHEKYKDLDVKLKDLFLFILFAFIYKYIQLRINGDLNSFRDPVVFYSLVYNILLIDKSLLLFKWTGLNLADIGLKKYDLSLIFFIILLFVIAFFSYASIFNLFPENYLLFSSYKLFLHQLIISGFPEELMDRGVLFLFIKKYLLKKQINPRYTIILSSIIFSLMHFTTLKVMLIIFIGGIIFAIIREETDNIYLSSLLHAFYNAYN
jgi:membrane protease YdiL (CAAX protease family)